VGWAASSGWQCRMRPSGDDVAVTKRERIDQDVLHRRAQVAVLSGLAAGEDVYDLIAAAAPSHVPGTGRSTCCVPPATSPTTSPKLAGRTTPR
jgi:hypothetical protein